METERPGILTDRAYFLLAIAIIVIILGGVIVAKIHDFAVYHLFLSEGKRAELKNLEAQFETMCSDLHRKEKQAGGPVTDQGCKLTDLVCERDKIISEMRFKPWQKNPWYCRLLVYEECDCSG